MPERFLVDTDVLIDYLRDQPEAVAYLEARPARVLTSAIVIAELFAGVRDGQERAVLDVFVQAFDVLPVDAEIAEIGGLFQRDYGPSHGTGLADALIAAMAERAGATLVTLNAAHFPMLKRTVMPYTKA